LSDGHISGSTGKSDLKAHHITFKEQRALLSISQKKVSDIFHFIIKNLKGGRLLVNNYSLKEKQYYYSFTTKKL
jgi:hypothetical protein